MKRSTSPPEPAAAKPPKKRILAAVGSDGQEIEEPKDNKSEEQDEETKRQYKPAAPKRSEDDSDSEEQDNEYDDDGGGVDSSDDIPTHETSKHQATSDSMTEGKPMLTGSNLPDGLVLKGGRVRLPDKLFEYLNKKVAPGALFWETGGQSFSVDTKKVQSELLDKHFAATKLTSFTRSLNRWGFKRVFHSNARKDVLCYQHPLFTRDHPKNVAEMKMPSAQDSSYADSTSNNASSGDGNRPTENAPAGAYLASPYNNALLASAGFPVSAASTVSMPTSSSLSSVHLPQQIPHVASALATTQAPAADISNFLVPALLQGLVSSHQQPNETYTQHQERQHQLHGLPALLANLQGQQGQHHLTTNLATASPSLGQIDIQALISLLTSQRPSQHQLLQMNTVPNIQQYQPPQQQLQQAFGLPRNTAGTDMQSIVAAAIAREQQKQAIEQLLLGVLTQHQHNEAQNTPADNSNNTTNNQGNQSHEEAKGA